MFCCFGGSSAIDRDGAPNGQKKSGIKSVPPNHPSVHSNPPDSFGSYGPYAVQPNGSVPIVPDPFNGVPAMQVRASVVHLTNGHDSLTSTSSFEQTAAAPGTRELIFTSITSTPVVQPDPAYPPPQPAPFFGMFPPSAREQSPEPSAPPPPHMDNGSFAIHTQPQAPARPFPGAPINHGAPVRQDDGGFGTVTSATV